MNAAGEASFSPRRRSVATPEMSCQILPFCHSCRSVAGSWGEGQRRPSWGGLRSGTAHSGCPAVLADHLP